MHMPLAMRAGAPCHTPGLTAYAMYAAHQGALCSRRDATLHPTCTHTSIPFVHPTREVAPLACRVSLDRRRATPVFPRNTQIGIPVGPGGRPPKEAVMGHYARAFGWPTKRRRRTG